MRYIQACEQAEQACLGKGDVTKSLPRQAYGEVTSRAFWNPDGQFLNCRVTWCQAAKELLRNTQ